ncbi:hypothetical protein DL98DRAFT_587566 [Cadophora sp. DSE1049]|nr:hypothetical protein DL98DRAFT_587566 [Cadophora sp. DSE1049]
MVSSTQNTPASDLPPVVPLSTCAKQHLAMVVNYDSSSGPAFQSPDPNGPASRIDDMIRELAARLDARIATDGPVLDSELELSPHKFPLFKKLPTEIRDKIWMFAAMNQPRNAVRDRWGRVTLYERNPPIILRQVYRHLRNMHPKVLGYTVLDNKSSVYDKICSYLFHPRVDMLSISRVYRRDAPNVFQKNPQQAMAILDALEKEKMLDKIRYLAINESILCKIPWYFLPPTRFELADPNWANPSNLHNGNLIAANPPDYWQINPPNLVARGYIISQFPNLELLLSVNTRCDHPAHASMDLNNTATEFERCPLDRPRRKVNAHLCVSNCYRVYNYITTQALRDDETSPRVLMVHDARRSSPMGGELWADNWSAW